MISGCLARGSVVFGALLVLTGSTAAAQRERRDEGRELFRWEGVVDREVQIVLHGGDLRTRLIGDHEPGRERAHVAMAVPQEEGYLTLQVEAGRGTVDVVQQPRARNDYTAIVRIRDDPPGAASYRVVAMWQPLAGIRMSDRRLEESRPPTELPSPAGAAGSLHWIGEVDNQVDIRIRGRAVDYATVVGAQPRNVNFGIVGQGLPRRDVRIVLTNVHGRGMVTVLQNPNERNGFTTLIRVSDPQSGYGTYEFTASWN